MGGTLLPTLGTTLYLAFWGKTYCLDLVGGTFESFILKIEKEKKKEVVKGKSLRKAVVCRKSHLSPDRLEKRYPEKEILGRTRRKQGEEGGKMKE